MTKPHRTPHAGELERLLDRIPSWVCWLLAIAELVGALAFVRLYFGAPPS